MHNEFKVGDKVIVARKVPTGDPDGMGQGKPWDNYWARAMDRFIGVEGTILDIDPELGAAIHSGFVPYYFPLAALEHVEQLELEGA